MGRKPWSPIPARADRQFGRFNDDELLALHRALVDASPEDGSRSGGLIDRSATVHALVIGVVTERVYRQRTAWNDGWLEPDPSDKPEVTK